MHYNNNNHFKLWKETEHPDLSFAKTNHLNLYLNHFFPSSICYVLGSLSRNYTSLMKSENMKTNEVRTCLDINILFTGVRRITLSIRSIHEKSLTRDVP